MMNTNELWDFIGNHTPHQTPIKARIDGLPDLVLTKVELSEDQQTVFLHFEQEETL